MTRFWIPFACAFACLAAAFAAQAQSPAFPSRPITIYVGTAPGGTMDAIARVLAPRFEKAWGQPVLVESRVGAGSLPASAAIVKAAPDGHALTMGGAPNASLFVKDVGFDPMKDTIAVSVVGTSNYFLLVTAASKLRTLREFVAQAKANPGKLNFGIVPAGAHQLETEEMQAALGVKLTQVGYKGIAPIYTALLAKEIDGTMGTSVPQLKTGEFVAVAVAGDRRGAEHPDIPTFREQGVAYDPMANYTLFAPGRTPKDILNRIAAEAGAAAKSPEFMTRITKVYAIDGAGLPHEASVEFIQKDFDRLKRAADRAGLKPQ